MNAKKITLRTIRENGFKIGKSIKGKGLEIYAPETRVMYSYGELSSMQIEEFKSLVEKFEAEKLYASSYYVDGIWSGSQSYETQVCKFIDLHKLFLANPKSFTSIQVNKIGDKLGYISLSKYKSDRQSQIELCQDLLKLQNLTVRGHAYETYCDIEYDDEIYNFKSHGEYYYKGDYALEHGSKTCESKSDCIYFDGRMSNYNETEMSIFEFDEGEYLKEIDPKESISVYHRKGKDWYIGYSLEEKEMNIYFRDENYEYDKEDCDNDSIFFVTYTENKDLINEVSNFLKSTKEDLEMRCFIANELDEDYDYRECNIDFKAVALCFDDVDDLKELICNSIEWKYETIKSDFSKAYNEALNERLKVDDNFKVTVETCSRFKVSSFTTYNHLAKLKRLENKYNYKLVQSAISENISMVSWAIKRDNEEYHFNLASLIAHDVEGEHSLKEFLANALSMLEKRRLEKIEESELYEKASKVFIGIQDSLSSGNCQLGTNQFVHKHNIDINKVGGIRGDILLEIEKSNFTLRAVSYAISRHTFAA